MRKEKWNLNTLCILALLTAMMVLLSLTLAVRTDYFKLTFGSLPVVLAAMLYGPLAGATVAVLGEFMVQLLTFGLMPTTVIWIFPPAIRAVVVGLAAVQLKKTGAPLESRPAVCYAVCILGAVLTTTGNTLVNWLDSILYHYYTFALIFGDALITPARYVSGVVTAAVIATLSMPLVQLLRRSGVLNETRHD